jgi:hypothetical protein
LFIKEPKEEEGNLVSSISSEERIVVERRNKRIE